LRRRAFSEALSGTASSYHARKVSAWPDVGVGSGGAVAPPAVLVLAGAGGAAAEPDSDSVPKAWWNKDANCQRGGAMGGGEIWQTL
jgi:hypothetical protein